MDMNINEILKQPEGRRLEFKGSMPDANGLEKTVIAFSNDAGGDFYLGIQDNPREIIGIPEEERLKLEEKICNMIHDNCYPVIHPTISFVPVDGKHLIKVNVPRGVSLPYYLKAKGKEAGTYIRVGSTNRLANSEMIAELERQKHNLSFDSEIFHEMDLEDIPLETLKQQYKEIAGEELTGQVIQKLELIQTKNGESYPTIALILLSDTPIRKRYFPMANIECARFKGTIPGNFIDQKTIDDNLVLQADLAFQFVKRHISQGSVDYTGVYRNDRWEYPVVAIREAIRNAIIHRDYSLSGQDIKIAIFDNKIEITSPGKLMPSIDFSNMEAGQSEIRNKVLAPIFQRIGIIEKWGNGLRIIHEELKNYPGIKFMWLEPGVSFRVVFEITTLETTLETTKETTKETTPKVSTRILQLISENPRITAIELTETIGNISYDGIWYHLKKLIKLGRIEHIGPTKDGYWKIVK